MTEVQEKLFTLVDGRQITVGPNVKILPQEAVTTLQTSIELLETVKKDAEEYKKEVAKECEKLKEVSEKEGFQAGFDQWKEMVQKLEAEINLVKEELQKTVMPVALKAAKKIVTTELTQNPKITLEIVMNTLKTVAQHKRIVVYVSKQDFEDMEKNKNKIKTIFEELESLSIREREDIEQGGCVIETEGGIINARLKDRWRTLEAAFTALAASIKPQKVES